MVAYFTEIVFPSRDIRFIAVNDSIDSAVGENEIMGFKSIINEFYARDISKKIKSSKHTRALAGEFTGYLAPLGYRKDPDDKHRLLVEEDGAAIVRRIFRLAQEGLGTTQIAHRLNEDGVPTPREHFNGKDGTAYQINQPMYTPKWTPASVRYILRNRAYLGSVVNGRTTTKSFKNQKRIYRPEANHIVVEDMHPPLVSEEEFELAQKVIKVKQRANNRQWDNIFQGLLKCADCGSNMSFAHGEQTTFGGYYMCNRYRTRLTVKEQYCSIHYTPRNTLTDAVLFEIRRQAAAAKAHEGNHRAYAERICGAKADKALAADRRELERMQKRHDELETIIRRLVEQNALGLIKDERFVSMTAGYEEEQAALKGRMADLQAQLTERRSQVDNTVKFLGVVQKYIDIETLDRGVLNEVIDYIAVHTGEGKAPNRTQKLGFHFRLAGELPEGASS